MPGATGAPFGTTAGLPGPASSASGSRPPLNLGLPRSQPAYPYRPPLAGQRSLSEMANEQLRRKPRDAFADSIENAAEVDCLKVNPNGTYGGLFAIGPILKKFIEDKCPK